VTGKKTREAIMFLTNVQLDPERKMETYEEGGAIATYYAKAIIKCLSYTSRWENFLDDKVTRLQSLAANAPQQVPDQAAPVTYDDIRETAPIHKLTSHNASAVATAQQLIANSNTTHLATTALTSFMDSVSRSNNFSDKHTELKILSASQNFPSDKPLRRCVFMLGADRIQGVNEWRVPNTTLLLGGLSTHRVKPQDWKCPGCWAKVITERTETPYGKGGKGNGGKETRRPGQYQTSNTTAPTLVAFCLKATSCTKQGQRSQLPPPRTQIQRQAHPTKTRTVSTSHHSAPCLPLPHY
jgi:hypothetical protein